MVVVATDAGGVYLFGDGVRHCSSDAALHGRDQAAPSHDRREVRGRDRDVSVLYLIIDFSLEMIDLIHRIYEADESFRSLNFLVHTQLYIPHIVIQICLGTLTPLILLGIRQVVKMPENVRKRMYTGSRVPGTGRHFCDAMECCDRRTTFSQRAFLATQPISSHLVCRREGLLAAIGLTVLPLDLSLGAGEVAATIWPDTNIHKAATAAD